MLTYFQKGLYINLMLFLQTAQHENPALSVPLGLRIIQWLHAAIQFKASSLTKLFKTSDRLVNFGQLLLQNVNTMDLGHPCDSETDFIKFYKILLI